MWKCMLKRIQIFKMASLAKLWVQRTIFLPTWNLEMLASMGQTLAILLSQTGLESSTED